MTEPFRSLIRRPLYRIMKASRLNARRRADAYLEALGLGYDKKRR